MVVGIHLGSSHSRTRGRASNEAKFVGRCSLAASTVGVILLNTPLVPTYGKRLALSKILVPTGACYCKARRIGEWMPAHRLPLEVHTNCASNFRAEDLFRLCRCSAVHRDLYQTAAYDEFLVELFVVDADNPMNGWQPRHPLFKIFSILTGMASDWDEITPSLERRMRRPTRSRDRHRHEHNWQWLDEQG